MEDQRATTAQTHSNPESVFFEELPPVEAAALHAQDLKDAPANVTLITRRQIRRFGYRTLAEVLSHVRGFYMSHDSTWYYAGVRGFSLPGDYNSRVLVMINGHQLTDNIYSAMYMFGQDFGLDMDLVERIEIIRGPSSALYGSNGVFATINIVTRSPVDMPEARLSLEVGSFGEKKLALASSVYLGRGANLLVAASGFHTSGRSLYLQELDSPETNFGRTAAAGAEQGYHSFTQLLWRNWRFVAYFNEFKGLLPTALYGTVFGDPGNSTHDGRNFLEAVWSRPVGRSAELRWRISYDQFRYRGRYDYAQEEGPVLDQRDDALGDWLQTQLYYRLPVQAVGDLTLGAETQADLRSLQRTYLVKPAFEQQLDVEHRDLSYAVFAQQGWPLRRTLTLYGGLRLDDSRRHRRYVSPRAAVVWQPAPGTGFKLTYGRAFRNPSAYEMFYQSADGFYVSAPDLGPERMRTLEATWQQKLHARLETEAALYRYRLTDLITETEHPSGGLRFRNQAEARATGLEWEIRARPTDWLESVGSVSWQRARAGAGGQRLVNSPSTLAQWRAAVPVIGERLTVALALRYWSSRLDHTGAAIPGAVVTDLTATTHRLHRDFDLQFGVRNLLNRRYSDPLSAEHPAVRMPRPGRTFFFSLIWSRGG